MFFFYYYFSGCNVALDPRKNLNKKQKKIWKSVVTMYFKTIVKYYLNAKLYKKISCND